MAQLKPLEGGYYLWTYLPSVPAAALFAVLFGLVTCYLLFKLFQTRAWYNTSFTIGGIFEIVGYTVRILNYSNTASVGLYAIQSVLILLGPVLFAATVYMTLGRIIRSLPSRITAVGGTTKAKSASLIPPNYLTKLFVASDILSFVVQGSGVGLMVRATGQTTSKAITVVGLLIQVIMFSFFIVVTVVFHRRVKAQLQQQQQQQIRLGEYGRPLGRLLYMLYAVSALILVRSIFRVIEYAMGLHGYILTHEWTLYVFDSVLMWSVMVMWAVGFPGTIAEEKAGYEIGMEEGRMV
ncbi:RTA1 domain-containing protein [Aspergillus saccharolyticus JOP 1030-1]|uniref:RTA1 domain protein n=1 Tax=Aspergillus saccharolyticus JOP 1030-1 TaxID=1450539 RepID=A0A318ZEB9_9EURO|nr:RTA1 domain protein [Aspergillus saccharolyticus JOP 1030-1]PYH45455.1 RTA1 domain protein [Aspergillus saccharolyticus JOP 1030-1]